jgi:phosphatidate cytidylyltransferase
VSGSSELGKRFGVAVALIAIAFAALWLHGVTFWLLVSAAGLLMLSEWAELSGVGEQAKRIALAALAVVLVALCPWLAGPGWLALALIAGAFVAVLLLTRSALLAAGIPYVALPILALLVLRAPPFGLLYVLWAMALVWACDTGAYFAGRAIGGPKLAPAISPNKTWAGFLGGVAAALLFGLILHRLAGLPLALALASAALAMVAQGGDLFESHLKRRAGVKDSGTLLPGHGGLLDRLDGLVPVAPLAALLAIAVAAGRL